MLIKPILKEVTVAKFLSSGTVFHSLTANDSIEE